MCFHIWKSLKRSMCALSLPSDFWEKWWLIGSKCKQRKAWLKEKKEENIKKNKVWPHQTDRPIRPSNQKQDLKLRITEIKFINCVLPRNLIMTFIHCCRATEERHTTKTQNQVLKAELSRTQGRNLKRYYHHCLGGKGKF